MLLEEIFGFSDFLKEFTKSKVFLDSIPGKRYVSEMISKV